TRRGRSDTRDDARARRCDRPGPPRKAHLTNPATTPVLFPPQPVWAHLGGTNRVWGGGCRFFSRMSEPLDLRERREMCDLMLELGPEAPTLCEGWTAFDLAAHLVVRERNPLSGPGNAFGGKAADFNEKLMAREKRHGFEEVVARARKIPFGIWSVPPIRSAF